MNTKVKILSSCLAIVLIIIMYYYAPTDFLSYSSIVCALLGAFSGFYMIDRERKSYSRRKEWTLATLQLFVAFFVWFYGDISAIFITVAISLTIQVLGWVIPNRRSKSPTTKL